ncbi:MAG: PEP-CTERM sorting domain-containing protein, partial [Alphaproteobacteria bacterium]
LVGPEGFGGGPITGGILPGGGGGNGGNIGGGPGNSGEPGTPISPVSPVPEPTTWVMVILGFAFLGITIRRRSAAFVTSQ